MLSNKGIQKLALLGVCLMSIEDNGVKVQNGVKSSLVVEVKVKQDNDPILLELKGAESIIREWRFSPKVETVYFTTRVDCVFLMWVS